MSIEVTCPNGHRLKVKDHWAGRMGHCPKCHAQMKVPDAPAAISDDDSDEEEEVLDEYEARLELATSGLSLLGSGVIGGKKVCKNCGKEANHWSASCGHCGTYFDGD